MPSSLPFHTATLLAFLCLATGCAAPPNPAATPTIPSIPTVAQPPIVEPTTTFTPTQTHLSTDPFICNDDWQSLPVIPEVTEAARGLYQQGVAQGGNPRAFSKIGDGEISTTWFLTMFDLEVSIYDLGGFQDLSGVIENFQGSFGRQSISARSGFNTTRILDPALANPMLCHSGESPLECELRLHNPSIAVLSLGTNQVHRSGEFEAGMRQILGELLDRRVLPILSTKGDNLEGDHRINRAIACLAQEYEVPLWNFWAAIQPLPNHGLQPDLEHLTYSGTNDFDDSLAMQSAWTVRNLTALQALDAIWRGVTR